MVSQAEVFPDFFKLFFLLPSSFPFMVSSAENRLVFIKWSTVVEQATNFQGKQDNPGEIFLSEGECRRVAMD